MVGQDAKPKPCSEFQELHAELTGLEKLSPNDDLGRSHDRFELGRGSPRREAFGAKRSEIGIPQTAHLLSQMLRLQCLGSARSWSTLDERFEG